MMYNDVNSMLVIYGLCAVTLALLALVATHLKKETLNKVSIAANQANPFCCEYCGRTKRIVCKVEDSTVVGTVVFGGGYMLGIWADDGTYIPSRNILPRNVAYVEALNNAVEMEVAK